MRRSKKEAQSPVVQVNISTGSLLKLVALVAVLVVLYYLWGIVAVFFVALLLASIIDPFADRLNRLHLPRGVAVAIVYILLLIIVSGVLILILPTMVEQFGTLLSTYAPFIEQASHGEIQVQSLLSENLFALDLNTLILTINESGLADSIPYVFSIVSDAFGGAISLILIFILAFYMVLEEDAMKRTLEWVTPVKYKPFVSLVAPKVRARIGAWLRGQLMVMVIVFALTYAALSLLGVPYALSLALLSGLLEVVPFLGPILSSIPAIVIAFSISPLQAGLVVVLYFAIQQLEGDVLTPKIMQKVGGLNPIVSIMAILSGFALLGVPGAILAIPVAMVVEVIASEWQNTKKI